MDKQIDPASAEKRGHISSTSQLSRTSDFSIGHPPPSLKTSHIEFVKDSHSERSTSCKDWHCRASMVKLSCFCKANFCITRKSILYTTIVYLGMEEKTTDTITRHT